MDRFKVPLSELEKVHVAREDQVEVTDASAPAPHLKTPEERERELMLRIAAG